jgi:hypothetical protein
MSFSTFIGSLGVTILLIAFFCNLFKYLHQNSKLYMALNIAGACLSGYASYLIHFMPFVILEGTWCMVAALALFKKIAAERIHASKSGIS